MDYPNLSGDEFKRIINLFKIIFVGTSSSIVIIVGVGLFFTYKDISTMRSDLREQGNSMKSEVVKIRDYSQKQIENSQNYASDQIKYINEAAKSQAKLSAAIKVQELFSDNTRIKNLIENTAEEKLVNELESFLTSQAKEYEQILLNQIEIVPQIITAADRIRNGNRDALELLDSLRTRSNSVSVKELAASIYESKKEDYLSAYKENVVKHWNPENKVRAINIGGPNDVFEIDKELRRDSTRKDELLDTLLNRVKFEKDLDEVSAIFIILDEILEQKIRMFEFDDIDQLSKSRR